MTSKTVYHTAYGKVKYVKVHEKTRDMGTNGRDAKIDTARKKVNGLYSVLFYPTDQETRDSMGETLSDPMFGGHPRWKTDEDGEYTFLTRKHEDPSGFEDFSGPPEVVKWYGDDKGSPWKLEEDGPIWNGSNVVMRYTTYGEGESQTVRLVKIGVIELGEVPEDYETPLEVGF